MTTAPTVSLLVLWLIVLVLAVAVLALVRQIGILHERIAPAGALMLAGGPKVGEQAPAVDADDLAGGRWSTGAPRTDGRSVLLFFLSPNCPVCKTLLPVLKSSRAAEKNWLDIWLASDGDVAAQREFIAGHELESFPYLLSSALGTAYQVGKLPYAVLIDEAGIIRAKGLVNSREHLESLFEARERGVASVQEFVAGVER